MRRLCEKGTTMNEFCELIPRVPIQDTIGNETQQFEVFCALLGDTLTLIDYGMLFAYDDGTYVQERLCMN